MASYNNTITGGATLMNSLAPAMAYFAAATDFVAGTTITGSASFSMPYARLGII
jgi:hypothetical protein